MKKILSTTLIVLITHYLFAQEIAYSNYYVDKLHINPAYSCIGDYSEVAAMVRNQWTQIENGYKICAAECQLKLPQSGIGICVEKSLKGGGAFSFTSASTFYAWQFNLNQSWKCAFAMGISYSSINLDQTKLVYYSQIDPAYGTIWPTSQTLNYDRWANVGFSTGTIIYTNKTLIGLSAYNIAKIAIIGEKNTRPTILSFIANYKIILKNNEIAKIWLVPNVIVKKYQQTNFFLPGIYLVSNILRPGLAYRIQQNSISTSQALIASLCIALSNIEISYAYDFDTSAKQNSIGASHEVALKLKFAQGKKISGQKTIICPAF